MSVRIDLLSYEIILEAVLIKRTYSVRVNFNIISNNADHITPASHDVVKQFLARKQVTDSLLKVTHGTVAPGNIHSILLMTYINVLLQYLLGFNYRMKFSELDYVASILNCVELRTNLLLIQKIYLFSSRLHNASA